MKAVIKNVVIFGVILWVINFSLNFVVEKIFDFFKLDSLYDTNMLLYGILTIVIGTIIYLIAVLATKKIVSLKLKINYEEAKKMLKVLVLIFFILNSVRTVVSYCSSLNLEEKLNNAISQLKEAKSSEKFQQMDETAKDTMNAMYKIYVDGSDKIINLENQRRNIIVVQWLSNTFIYIVCLYGFASFLYRKKFKGNQDEEKILQENEK